MHLDPEQVQRLLHGQLPGSADTAARAHLAACDACGAELAAAEREEHDVFALLRAVDHAPPPLTAEAVIARARGKGLGPMRWAAGALLALGVAGAAYAMPGSPVRAWVEAIGQRLAGPPGPSREAPGPALVEPPAVAGIAVAPGRQLRIVFTSYQAVGEVRVSLTDSAEVSARAPVGAATFSTGGDRLVIANDEGTATFEIRIPRTAPWIEIHVGGSRVFLKRGPDVTTALPAAPPGAWVLPMTRPER